MRRRNALVTIVAVFSVLTTCQGEQAQRSISIEMSTRQSTIQCGDPMAIEIRLTFAKPRVSRTTGGVWNVAKLEDPELHVKRGTAGDSTDVYYLLPIRALLCDDAGLKYSAHVSIWWESRIDGREREQQLVFSEPGTYDLTISDGRNGVSNTVSVTVEPSVPLEKGLAVLTEPNDFWFLGFGVKGSAQTLKRLERLVERCPRTRLAQMAAARLGIEYADQLEKKYPAGEVFRKRYQQGEIKEPLVESAHSYLSKAQRLPSEFPICENVLARLAATELTKGDSAKAFSILDELAKKYPRGKYGRQAERTKAKFTSLVGAELEAPGAAHSTSWHIWGIPVVVITIGAFSVGYFLLVRKRNGTQVQ